jgi:hypothetical protein
MLPQFETQHCKLGSRSAPDPNLATPQGAAAPVSYARLSPPRAGGLMQARRMRAWRPLPDTDGPEGSEASSEPVQFALKWPAHRQGLR